MYKDQLKIKKYIYICVSYAKELLYKSQYKSFLFVVLAEIGAVIKKIISIDRLLFIF